MNILNDQKGYEQVKASGRDVQGFTGMIGDWEVNDATGRVYLDGLAFIVDCDFPDDCPDRGRWYTIIDGEEYQSDSLESLEFRIANACAHGVYTRPTEGSERE